MFNLNMIVAQMCVAVTGLLIAYCISYGIGIVEEVKIGYLLFLLIISIPIGFMNWKLLGPKEK